MNTGVRIAIQLVVGAVLVVAVIPLGYFVYSVTPGFLLGIGLAFWVDAIMVAVGLRLIFALRSRDGYGQELPGRDEDIGVGTGS